MKHSRTILLTMLVSAAASSFAHEGQHDQHAQKPAQQAHQKAQQAQAQRNAQHPKVAHAMTSSPGAAKAPYDAQFLDSMSAHHQGGVDMAMLVPERAQHDDLKEKAKQIIEKQNKEIHKLQSWKIEWYPNQEMAVNLRLPGMKAMDMKHMEMLSFSKGHAFDLHFLEMMIKHHQGGIVMAQNALKRSKRPEIKQQARMIIADQKKEQAEMKKWHKQWSAGHH